MKKIGSSLRGKKSPKKLNDPVASSDNDVQYNIGKSGMITSIMLTGGGGTGGGGTMFSSTTSGCGLTQVTMPNTGSYTMPNSGTVSLGSGVYSISTGTTTYTNTPYHTTFDSDITINRPGGKINIGKSIETILDHLNLIIPVQSELDSNPALKLAYENYLEVLDASRNRDIREAYDSYHTVKKLTKDSDD